MWFHYTHKTQLGVRFASVFGGVLVVGMAIDVIHEIFGLSREHSTWLMHPKNPADLEVSDGDWGELRGGVVLADRPAFRFRLRHALKKYAHSHSGSSNAE